MDNTNNKQENIEFDDYIFGFKKALNRYVVDESDDEAVDNFIKNVDDMCLDAELDAIRSILYKGSQITYLTFEPIHGQDIMDMVENSKDPKAYSRVASQLLQPSTVFVNKNKRNEKLAIIKMANSEYTVLELIVTTEKDYLDDELLEIVAAIYTNEAYIDGLVDEFEWASVMNKIK